MVVGTRHHIIYKYIGLHFMRPVLVAAIMGLLQKHLMALKFLLFNPIIGYDL